MRGQESLQHVDTLIAGHLRDLIEVHSALSMEQQLSVRSLNMIAMMTIGWLEAMANKCAQRMENGLEGHLHVNVSLNISRSEKKL